VSFSETVESIGKEERQQFGIWAARGLLLLVAMLWGTNFASVKYLETLCFHPPCNHPPSEAALARFGVAAIVSLPLLIGQRKDVILAGFECGLWITLGYITQAMALQTISSGKCAFICSLTVVVVPLLSSLFGKPIKPINIVSAIIALTGVGVLEGLVDVTSLTEAFAGAQPALAAPGTNMAESASAIESFSVANAAMANPGVLGTMANAIGISKGDLLALGQPLGFGLSFMRIEHYVEKFEDVENRILTIAAAECVIVGVVSLFWVLYDFHGIIPDFGYMVRLLFQNCLVIVFIPLP
jgi:drug/metabolite transporter (DMT)-like permease